MPEDVAIKVDHVSKDFVLPHNKITSLKGAFTSVYRRKQKSNETQHALRDISFDVKEGEFFGIVGRNGSGKSTLLKIIAEIYQPTKGKLHKRGKLVPFIELGVGFNPELTGRENVYLNGALLGFSSKEVDAMYDDIVGFAELEQFMDQKLKNYSSGMQVRLAFSVATRAKADILLIDEVLAVGDADFQRKCFAYFHELKKLKKTVIFVSHDMDAVREYCDRAVLIEKSKIVDIGSTAKIAEQYTKQFLKEGVVTRQGDDSGRWGTEEMKFGAVDVKVQNDSVVIEQTIVANKETVDPIVGFRIRNGENQDVLGTNTKIEEITLGTIPAGKTIKLSWRFDNILSDGEYSLDPAVLAKDGITVMDWWDGAIAFTVHKARHLPYDVDPKFTVDVKART